MGFPQDAVLPQGALILVTGVTGFLASIIADQLLSHGYRVRGTARDLRSEKASWVSQKCTHCHGRIANTYTVPKMPDHFDSKYGGGRFEMVQVVDMAQEGCLDTVVKDCDGIIHVASVVDLQADPNKIITPSVAFLNNALSAAERTPSIKRFVYTSSSAAASPDNIPRNEVYNVTDKTWADWAIREAWAPPPYTCERVKANYYASKAQTEKKLWEYVEDKKKNPTFVVNAVLPDFILSLGVSYEMQGAHSSMALFKDMLDRGVMWTMLGPQWCIDGVDTALLHLAALLHPRTKNERIFGFAHRKTWTDFIQRLRRMYPNRFFPEPDPDEGEELSNIVNRQKAEDLLKWMGRTGWRPLDDSLKEVCDTMLD